MYNDVITLVKIVKSENATGDIVETPTPREIFAQVKSIGANEFYQAQATGFKPELKFVIADYYDYGNEQKLIYEGNEYNIIRTYRNGTELEITCGGNNYANAQNIQV